MKRLAAVLPVLLVLAVVAFLMTGNGLRNERVESARLRASLDSLAAVGARVDTVYRADTLRLWRLVRSTDTLTATVETWKHDTVRVVEYVTRADSTIRACTATVETCEERVANRDARLAVLDSLNRDTERRLAATARKARRDRILWGLGGAGVGWLAKP